MAFAGQTLELLDEPPFAGTRLAAEQHELSVALQDLVEAGVYRGASFAPLFPDDRRLRGDLPAVVAHRAPETFDELLAQFRPVAAGVELQGFVALQLRQIFLQERREGLHRGAVGQEGNDDAATLESDPHLGPEPIVLIGLGQCRRRQQNQEILPVPNFGRQNVVEPPDLAPLDVEIDVEPRFLEHLGEPLCGVSVGSAAVADEDG